MYIQYISETGYKESHSLSDKLKKYIQPDIEAPEKESLEIEIKCFNFFSRHGDLIPLFENIGKDGVKYSYPDLNTFSEKEILYLKSRIQNETHPFPKGRYSHILWKITKHNDYAHVAIDSYKKLTELYLSDSISGLQLFHEMIASLFCYHNLSATVKYETDECKSYIKECLYNEDIPILWKDNILNIIVHSPLFKKKDFIGITQFVLDLELGSTTKEYFNIDSLLKLGLEIAKKEGVPQKELFNRLGDNEIRLAEKRESDETGIILITCYQRAAYYYRMADNLEKYNYISGLYTEQKTKMKLGSVQIELPPEKVKAHNDLLNNLIDTWLSKSKYNPLWFLVYNKDLLISEDVLIYYINDNKENSIIDFAQVHVFDLNNNSTLLTDEQKVAHKKFQRYSLQVQLFTLPILDKFFHRTIREGLLDRKEICLFFSSTWFAKEIDEFTLGESMRQFTWLDLILPGVYEIVSQIEFELSDPKFISNYLLAIDSLSIKIEGIIRELARISGAPVSKMKDGESVEMNLEELLRDETVCSIFEPDDVLYFKYILTRQGWNYRNNVAHSFYRPADYNRTKALFLLLAVFRLCKYDFKKKD